MPVEANGEVTMGTLLDKLVEVAGTYRECQAAALGKADTARAPGARKP